MPVYIPYIHAFTYYRCMQYIQNYILYIQTCTYIHTYIHTYRAKKMT